MNEPHTLRQKMACLFEGTGQYHRAGHILDIALISLIMINVVAIVIESIPSVAEQYYNEFLVLEIVSVAIFAIEYLARLWACVDKTQYLSLIHI